MDWWKDLKGQIKFNEPLKNHTTFRIGGPAKFFYEPDGFDDLKSLLRLVKSNKLDLRVIGAGSNILAGDKGVKGVVLHFGQPYFKKIKLEKNRLKTGCGAALSRLVKLSSQKGLKGLEFLAGIPGSVGGALVMNVGVSLKSKSAKTKIQSISDSLENVTVVDYNGKIRVLHKKDIKFSYRGSDLKKYIVLNAEFNLTRNSRKRIEDAVKGFLRYRKSTQDYRWPSAGCVFKNPKGSSAGKLIDQCGLKAKKIGNLHISSKHANFILNKGSGRFSDALKLMKLIKTRVRNKFKIELKPEIKIWK